MPNPDVIYLRVPHALREALDQWAESIDWELSDVCREFLRHAVDHPPETLKSIRELRVRLAAHEPSPEPEPAPEPEPDPVPVG